MASLKKLALMGVASIGLTSCASVYEPYPTELKKIINQPYEKGEFDCKHKSVLDSDFLNEQGVSSNIIYGKINEKGSHCWQEIYNPETDKNYARDATGNLGGWEINQYPKREKGKWVQFEKGVTVEELKKFEKIKKVYWENIPENRKPFFEDKMRQQNKK